MPTAHVGRVDECTDGRRAAAVVRGPFRGEERLGCLDRATVDIQRAGRERAQERHDVAKQVVDASSRLHHVEKSERRSSVRSMVPGRGAGAGGMSVAGPTVARSGKGRGRGGLSERARAHLLLELLGPAQPCQELSQAVRCVECGDRQLAAPIGAVLRRVACSVGRTLKQPRVD